jgi:peptidoglycan/xylan/chitin deacetylase (PgdA/CDA1 family)
VIPREHRPAALVVSLDFELHWGVRDVPLSEYRKNLMGARAVVPHLLALFRQYDVHATWAVVGFLFCETRDELMDSLPQRKPRYVDARLSPYQAISREVGRDERADPIHFAPSLIRAIAATPHQEIGTHTFSHYYCLEDGQDVDDFREDLRVAVRVTEKLAPAPRSLVFPRNQFRADYLETAASLGILAYRGNPRSWMYRASSRANDGRVRRGLRLLDAYLPIPRTQPAIPPNRLPCDVPATRFLRPYARSLRRFEPLRLRRLVNELERTVRRRGTYHLWWHPHNFGCDQKENLEFLARFLDRVSDLRRSGRLVSLTMAEAANQEGSACVGS